MRSDDPSQAEGKETVEGRHITMLPRHHQIMPMLTSLRPRARLSFFSLYHSILLTQCFLETYFAVRNDNDTTAGGMEKAGGRHINTM